MSGSDCEIAVEVNTSLVSPENLFIPLRIPWDVLSPIGFGLRLQAIAIQVELLRQ